MVAATVLVISWWSDKAYEGRAHVMAVQISVGSLATAEEPCVLHVFEIRPAG